MYVVSMACTYDHNLTVMSKLMQFNRVPPLTVAVERANCHALQHRGVAVELAVTLLRCAASHP